jgi:hypothetical protein
MSMIPKNILAAGCAAYHTALMTGPATLGEGIEAAYFAIHDHDDWVRAGPPEWTGEGLPPVGTVCEFKANILGWVQATITAVTDLSIVFTRPSYQNGRPLVEERLPHKAIERFRPILTPEQIAEQDRDKAINQMEFDTGYLDRGAFTKLYDAGWRKVTP